MIGLDTNVVVRMLANDDLEQVERIRTFLNGRSAEDPAYISAVVLAETIWVLESRMGYDRNSVLGGIEKLLSSGDLHVEFGDRLYGLLHNRHTDQIDIADHLVAWSSEAAGCSQTLTFDRRAAARIPSMELLA